EEGQPLEQHPAPAAPGRHAEGRDPADQPDEELIAGNRQAPADGDDGQRDDVGRGRADDRRAAQPRRPRASEAGAEGATGDGGTARHGATLPERRAVAPARDQFRRSTSIAWPMPPATHIDSMPYVLSSVSRSLSSVVM